MRIIPASILDHVASADEIITRLLKLREITNINGYLNPPVPWDITLRDFGYSAASINRAIQLVKAIRESGDPVVVYTDYDADGITGGAILWETLYKLGCKAVPYVPHRTAEGYGFSKAGIDNAILQYKPRLFISVDHGIAAIDQVDYIRRLGIPVIITDHHQKQERVPDADAIFHIPALSGAGVAYYFAKELWQALDPDSAALGALFRTDYLSFAAIGSIADLVPLKGATRSLVKYGLGTFEGTTRVGLRQMMMEAKIDGRQLHPHDIGFVIAPRINAVGRLGHALDALRLLCTTDIAKAESLTRKLSEMNTDRKKLLDTALEEAVSLVEKGSRESTIPELTEAALPGSPEVAESRIPPLIILRSDNWQEGIIGLIAARLCEQYFRPVIIITRSGNTLKASCRSPATVDITALLSNWKQHFLSYGGHHQAAGFSLAMEQYPVFINAVARDIPTLISDNQLIRTYHADLQLPLGALSLELAEKLTALEPFGQGNPRPAFSSQGKVIEVKRIGGGSHLKMFVRDPEHSSVPVEIIAFKRGADYDVLADCPDIQVLYSLETNTWNGKTSIQGKLLHWQPAR